MDVGRAYLDIMNTGRTILIAMTVLFTALTVMPEATAIECEGIWSFDLWDPSLYCYQCLPRDFGVGECVDLRLCPCEYGIERPPILP